MSFGFRSGSTPMRTDTKWVRWAKILAHYQTLSGADPRNDLVQTNSVRQIKVKVLESLGGIGSGALVGTAFLFENPDNALEWTWDQANPTTWSVQQTDTPDQNWVEILTPAGSARSAVGMTLFKWYRVVAVGGSFDGTASNTVFIGL